MSVWTLILRIIVLLITFFMGWGGRGMYRDYKLERVLQCCDCDECKCGPLRRLLHEHQKKEEEAGEPLPYDAETFRALSVSIKCRCCASCCKECK